MRCMHQMRSAFPSGNVDDLDEEQDSVARRNVAMYSQHSVAVKHKI